MTEHTATAAKEPTIEHLYADLVTAVEKGSFLVETPRVYVDHDGFERVHVTKTRDTGKDRTGRIKVGGWRLDLTLEWVDRPDFTRDVNDHINQDGSFVLYGHQNVWGFDRPWGGSMDSTYDDEIVASTARFEWRDSDMYWIGWR